MSVNTVLEVIKSSYTLEVTRDNATLIEVIAPGPRGPKGFQGDKGDKGETGDYFEIGLYSFVISRNGDGSVYQLTYSNGTVLTMNRNLDGSVSSITSNIGKTKIFNRNPDGSVLSITLS